MKLFKNFLLRNFKKLEKPKLLKLEKKWMTIFVYNNKLNISQFTLTPVPLSMKKP